jgi:hypothetical protein
VEFCGDIDPSNTCYSEETCDDNDRCVPEGTEDATSTVVVDQDKVDRILEERAASSESGGCSFGANLPSPGGAPFGFLAIGLGLSLALRRSRGQS